MSCVHFWTFSCRQSCCDRVFGLFLWQMQRDNVDSFNIYNSPRLILRWKLRNIDITMRSGQSLWCGVVWCGVVWCGVVWCGVVWCGVVWCGVMWCDVMWCDVMWCDVMWCDVMWCDVIQGIMHKLTYQITLVMCAVWNLKNFTGSTLRNLKRYTPFSEPKFLNLQICFQKSVSYFQYGHWTSDIWHFHILRSHCTCLNLTAVYLH